MNRALLIARREYLAYARTVGFWLSLLALPFFAVLGGAIPILMQRAEPVHMVAMVEAPSDDAGALSEGVRRALDEARVRRTAEALRNLAVSEAGLEGAEAVRRIAADEGTDAGLAELRRVAPRAGAGYSPPRETLVLVDTPGDLQELAGPDDARERVQPWFNGDRLLDDGEQLDAVVILSRQDGGAPSAVVWAARATDRTVEHAVRHALTELNRREALAAAGVDPGLIRD
ncbi:MAG: ABC transporter permease, partial [Brevundimonas sp.]